MPDDSKHNVDAGEGWEYIQNLKFKNEEVSVIKNIYQVTGSQSLYSLCKGAASKIL